MAFVKTVNVKDAAEAKAFLFGHSRTIKTGTYINKYRKGIRLKEGVIREDADNKFEELLKGASEKLKTDTGYAIAFNGKRFELAKDGENDPVGLFNGEQMKVASLNEETLKAHAAVIVLFDEACDGIVEGYRAAVGAPAGVEDAEESTEAAAVSA